MTVWGTASLVAAKRLLETGACTCVACGGSVAYTSMERGIGPLVGWIESGTDLSGCSLADRVMGKSAALLCSLLGVREAYAPVVSEQALAVCAASGITVRYDARVPCILNRMGTARCPYEDVVWDIDDPREALAAIKRKRAELARLPLSKQG